jgi:2-oxoisovalerate dehydrogenase E1 component beta subunit
MIQQAIESDDPIVFYEPKRRYHEKGEVDLTATEAPRPLFQATIARAGEHATLAAYGPMVKVCLDAATVAAEEGRSIEVIDLRSLSPLDLDVLATSVEKTGRLVVAHEAPTFMGMGAEIAAAISQRCFYHLESPVIRVGGYNLPYPPSRLEEDFLPDLDRVLDGVDRALAY